MANRSSAEVELAPLIDHTLLTPWATSEQVRKWCEEVDRYGFAAVCVAPCHVREAVALLHQKKSSKNPQICTVIGFPTGAQTTATKLYEAQEAAENGATELDVVINLGWLKAGRVDELHNEIAMICEETGLVIKAILETNVLSEAEIQIAAEICMEAGARYLKTCTGWQGGATIDAVRQLNEIVKGRVGIKASGGIRTAQQAYNLVLAGATRLGTSHGVTILTEAETLD